MVCGGLFSTYRFAKLWEIDEEEYWGYITTCGTEGNLHGILTGRENLPDGILYASQESHYSGTAHLINSQSEVSFQ